MILVTNIDVVGKKHEEPSSNCEVCHRVRLRDEGDLTKEVATLLKKLTIKEVLATK